MIFKPDLLELVLSGRKTQTRRPVKTNGVKGSEKPCPYEPGKTYAVQPGRGQRAVGRILVRAVDRVTVAAIDPDDAHAEGFNSVVDFLAAWHSFYGTVQGEAWRIVFERSQVPRPCECGSATPGILWPMRTDGDGTRDWIERCDDCQIYPDDRAAARALAAAGRPVAYAPHPTLARHAPFSDAA